MNKSQKEDKPMRFFVLPFALLVLVLIVVAERKKRRRKAISRVLNLPPMPPITQGDLMRYAREHPITISPAPQPENTAPRT